MTLLEDACRLLLLGIGLSVLWSIIKSVINWWRETTRLMQSLTVVIFGGLTFLGIWLFLESGEPVMLLLPLLPVLLPILLPMNIWSFVEDRIPENWITIGSIFLLAVIAVILIWSFLTDRPRAQGRRVASKRLELRDEGNCPYKTRDPKLIASYVKKLHRHGHENLDYEPLVMCKLDGGPCEASFEDPIDWTRCQVLLEIERE